MNPQPADYKSAALPIELRQLTKLEIVLSLQRERNIFFIISLKFSADPKRQRQLILRFFQKTALEIVSLSKKKGPEQTPVLLGFWKNTTYSAVPLAKADSRYFSNDMANVL